MAPDRPDERETPEILRVDDADDPPGLDRPPLGPIYPIDPVDDARAAREAKARLELEVDTPSSTFEVLTVDQQLVRRSAHQLLEHARQRLEPDLDKFLDSLMADAIAGGRHSDTARRLIATVMLGIGGSSEVTNVFIGRLGVPEEDARVAVDQYEQARRMDPFQIAMVAARYINGYVTAHPERRAEVIAAVIGQDPRTLTAGGKP